MEKAILKIKGEKLKATKQRIAIYSYLLNTKEHPTAEVVFNYIKKTSPNVSFSTIYKNLNLLCENNLVREISIKDNFKRFDADTTNHTHLFCMKCKKLMDSEVNIPIQNMNLEIVEKDNFICEKQYLIIEGYCTNCN